MHKLEVQFNRERMRLPELYSMEDLWQLAVRKLNEEEFERRRREREKYQEKDKEYMKALVEQWHKEAVARFRKAREAT